ncbi:hypothetical protein EJ04DRAFT_570209 [Polyplosphaeria fusca]|uniref:Uncharacterized protein n=1 Tax=Polyplosphaeria fusca TaxID=682080 RepID=A0A9P4UTA9_9PLEO|nr:hypothetical protein EJ04DRAFT_570209 [Polyplosphaeria fusca]
MQSPTFPTNKRHAMLFGGESPHSFITATFPNPKMEHMSPSNVAISVYHTPDTIEEALTLSSTPPPPPPHQSKFTTPSRPTLPRSGSSTYYLEVKKSPSPKQEPRSRKTNQATIKTEATDTQPEFESDAFAIHMPTTREPIIDSAEPSLRMRLPTASKAQIEAYRTYKEKAQQVRENEFKNKPVRGTEYKNKHPPSKIVSYDYAYGNGATSQPLELHINPPKSPLAHSPAGAFPNSPPLKQGGWAQPGAYVHGPRSMSESEHLLPRRPVGLANIRIKDKNPFQHGDSHAGARSSPSPTPDRIRVRIVPRTKDPNPPQKESRFSLYNRLSPNPSPTTSSSPSSRSPSPTKPTPTSGDPIFGYTTTSITGTPAPPPKPPKKPWKWAWLRPTPVAARSAKPTPSKQTAAYMDPFLLHATPAPTHPNTPTSSRPASPKKLIRVAAHKGSENRKGEFDSGFAQVKSAGGLVVKVCLVVYALVGLYFILDAIREAVHALGAPFRVVRVVGGYVLVGGMWVGRGVGGMWERWGVRVALRGGWRGLW